MTIAELQPAIDALLATRLRNAQPALWTNPARQAQPAAALPALGRTISLDDTHAAAARLARFAGLLAQVFPELAATGGVVESPLLPAAALAPAPLATRMSRRPWRSATRSTMARTASLWVRSACSNAAQ